MVTTIGLTGMSVKEIATVACQLLGVQEMAFDYVVVLAVGTLILAIAIGLCFAISDSRKPRNNQDAELRAARRLKNSDYAIGELEPIRVNCDL